MLLQQVENVNTDIVQHYADKVTMDLRSKWELYRGLIDTPCNLVYLRDDIYLFLSATSISETEHTVLLSSEAWGLKAHYPIDKIETAVKSHMLNRAGLSH